MLENFSVHQIISKIKKREIKIVEVLNFYLDRIKKFNPKLNAIISHIDETKITEEAKLKDENFNSDNDKDDIYGLPIAVKELFDIKNEVTCYGYKELLKNIPKQNSLLVDNYKKNAIFGQHPKLPKGSPPPQEHDIRKRNVIFGRAGPKARAHGPRLLGPKGLGTFRTWFFSVDFV